VPTVADLRARRLELTRGSLEEALLEGEESLETYRAVVNALAAEYDVVLIARADGTLAADVRPLEDDRPGSRPVLLHREILHVRRVTDDELDRGLRGAHTTSANESRSRSNTQYPTTNSTIDPAPTASSHFQWPCGPM